jgi:hypothetical protein
MAIKPVVRYMLLCEGYEIDPVRSRRITIVGLLSSIRSRRPPYYPLIHPSLCVFLVLTEGYGAGSGHVVCVSEATGNVMFRTPPRPLQFPASPLGVVSVSFVVEECRFPKPGLYSVQFWYENELVEERPLLLR